MSRGEEAAFDSKSSSGLRVSRRLLCPVFFSVLWSVPALSSGCGRVSLQLSNLHISSLFSQDNCSKNSGSPQEGVDFDDNSHNSLEPRGWWEWTAHCTANRAFSLRICITFELYEALSGVSAESINSIQTTHTFGCHSVLHYCFSWSKMRRLMLLLFLCAVIVGYARARLTISPRD